MLTLPSFHALMSLHLALPTPAPTQHPIERDKRANIWGILSLLAWGLAWSMVCLQNAPAQTPSPTVAATQPSPAPMAPTASAAPQVKFVTSMGEFVLELYPDKAPKTVANFLQYVKDHHYDGTIFHRVINSFMVQGGGFDAKMKEKKALAQVENEANNGLKNDHYTVAMARTSDPHSAGAQFFINVSDNDFLNHTSPTPSGWGYAVFGRVIKGQEIVDLLGKVKTTTSGFYDDVPKEMVLIEKAIIL